MAEPLSLFDPQPPQNSVLNKSKNQDITISDTYTEELVFGLCGPIGTPIHKVSEVLKEILETNYGYECVVLRLSEFIKDEIRKEDPNQVAFQDEYDKLNKLIDAGDRIRKKYRPSYLAELAIEKIAESRTNELDINEKKKIAENTGELIHYQSRRKCFLIDSIKNQYELDILKAVYRDLFYFIGVFSPKSKLEEELQRKRGLKPFQAQILIDKDSGESIDRDYAKYGQTVRKTFPQADLFIRIDRNTEEHLRFKVERFLHLIFNTKIITPTNAETAMYLAAAASGNSACLSRQVGACLTDSEGSVISVGWNDVPKAGGRLYQFKESDKLGENDNRCMNIDNGKCHNDLEKERLAREIAEKMIDEGISQKKDQERIISILLNTRLKSLIEFSRAIHAEMYALISAGQNNGSKIIGSSLYCTTYPCHNCARHLIAAGVMNIFYIEPYPKSMAIKLHSDSITEDEKDLTKVRLLAFDGVSPNRYLQFFTYKQDDRKKIFRKGINTSEILPKNEVTLESLPILESIIVKRLNRLKEGKNDE